MKNLLPYLPVLNVLVIPLMGFFFKHEKEHAKLWLLLRQVCKKLNIEDGG